MAEKLLFIACGGGIGAALRYVISAWASAHVKLFIVTGILGGFTTFSTYNLEFITLLRTGSFTYACTYALLNIVITFLCCFAGLIIGELLF